MSLSHQDPTLNGQKFKKQFFVTQVSNLKQQFLTTTTTTTNVIQFSIQTFGIYMLWNGGRKKRKKPWFSVLKTSCSSCKSRQIYSNTPESPIWARGCSENFGFFEKHRNIIWECDFVLIPGVGREAASDCPQQVTVICLML